MIRRTRERVRNSYALVPAALFLAAGVIGVFLMGAQPVAAQELVIGETESMRDDGGYRVSPGIVFIFEGAVRDHVAPTRQNMAEAETDVHIEARVNWDETNIPDGTPPGGFVPYLNISARVTNESDPTKVAFVPVPPHINLVDNFHYAYNMQLPGARTDSYKVEFFIDPPRDAVSKHRDWLNNYGRTVMLKRTFTFTGVNFMEIACAAPRDGSSGPRC